MSQPPTLFPKSPLGSAQNSGNGSSAGGAATPAEQRPRFGVTPTPGAAPAAPAAKPVAPAPASPFRTTVPAPASPAQGTGLTGSAFRTPAGAGAAQAWGAHRQQAVPPAQLRLRQHARPWDNPALDNPALVRPHPGCLERQVGLLSGKLVLGNQG